MLHVICPYFGPTKAGLRSFCSLRHQKLNIADLLLFRNTFHLPKYTGSAFLTLRGDLCIWSGNAVKGEAMPLNMAGEGKVMTLSSCVFGGWKTTAGSSL